MKEGLKHHIVIVGGGAGGLELATSLGRKLGKKKRAKITLIDASLTHIWKPLLHEVAAGSLDSGANEINFRAHAKRSHFNFQLGTMKGLNRASKTISVAAITDETGDLIVNEREIPYDSLVIAVGSNTNDFGTPGAAEHCRFLDTHDQAKRFHNILLNAFLKAEFQSENNESHSLNIAIIGAGATGVELAAELHFSAKELPNYGLSNLKKGDIQIHLIEAAPTILPALPKYLSDAATLELDALGIQIKTGQRVTGISQDSISFENGETLKSSLSVWAAGIKAPTFLADLDGLEHNRINQLCVTETLQTTEDPNIFAIGDCASCPRPGHAQSVPPRAQAAHQQASLLSKSLKGILAGEAPLTFSYRDYGSFISFSRYSAVGNLMGRLAGKNLMIEGRLARLFYISLYRMHQIALFGFTRTGLIWLNDMFTKALRTKLKLH